MTESGYYVTIKRGTRTGFLLGPYAIHSDALTRVNAARDAATEIDGAAWFDLIGTSKLTSANPLPLGVLNKAGILPL